MPRARWVQRPAAPLLSECGERNGTNHGLKAPIGHLGMRVLGGFEGLLKFEGSNRGRLDVVFFFFLPQTLKFSFEGSSWGHDGVALSKHQSLSPK